MAELEYLPVAAARAGDPEAWDVLFRRYQLPLYVYVFELVHEEQPSLDLVQETFINAARHVGSLRSDDKFGSWLFGIAHQKCVQHWRKLSRANIWWDEWVEEPFNYAEDPFELLIRDEQQNEFMELLNQLPLPQRSVLLLYFVEDFSLDEIAVITGASLGTVKSRMHYAKKTLKNLIEEQTP